MVLTLRWGPKRVAYFCRELGTFLNAGVPVSRALSAMAEGGRPPTRRAARRLAAAIENGATFEEAIRGEGRRFPRLIAHIIPVAERSGRLDSVLTSLGEYYALLHRLWVAAIVGLSYVIGEYWAGVLVLAFICFIRDMDYVAVLRAGVLNFTIPILLYFVVTRALEGRRWVQRLLWGCPVIAYTVRNLAFGRFAWGMEMASDAGLPARDALALSVEAAGNPFFRDRAGAAHAHLEAGGCLTDALGHMRLFPDEFLQLTSAAEHSGDLSGVFSGLAREHLDRAEASFAVAIHLLFWPAWLLMAGLMWRIYF